MDVSLAPPSVPDRLAIIVQWLRAALAAHAGRDRRAVAVVWLAWPYLSRLATRFVALAERVRTGKVCVVAPARLRAAPDAPRPRSPSLPSGFAWMIRLTQSTAVFGSQLRHLLTDPAFAALLAQAPQAGRLLRPLCRMLGIEPGPDLPPALFAPPRLRPPRTRASSTPEPLAASSPAPMSPAPMSPMTVPPTPERSLDRRYLRPRTPAFRTALA